MHMVIHVYIYTYMYINIHICIQLYTYMYRVESEGFRIWGSELLEARGGDERVDVVRGHDGRGDDLV